jgi:hypothetical protein
MKFDDLTFEDVMEVTQFKSRKAILLHFPPTANNKPNADRDVLPQIEFAGEYRITILAL